ncbi:MAG: hypothetical protein EHM21_16990, partial [Chloroflexi bacterium]
MKYCHDTSVSRPRVGGGQRLLIPFTILLLVSLACAVPDLGQLNRGSGSVTLTPVPAQAQPAGTVNAGIPEASQAGAQAVQPTAAPDYPPALVEVDPLPGS